MKPLQVHSEQAHPGISGSRLACQSKSRGSALASAAACFSAYSSAAVFWRCPSLLPLAAWLSLCSCRLSEPRSGKLPPPTVLLPPLPPCPLRFTRRWPPELSITSSVTTDVGSSSSPPLPLRSTADDSNRDRSQDQAPGRGRNEGRSDQGPPARLKPMLDSSTGTVLGPTLRGRQHSSYGAGVPRRLSQVRHPRHAEHRGAHQHQQQQVISPPFGNEGCRPARAGARTGSPLHWFCWWPMAQPEAPLPQHRR